MEDAANVLRRRRDPEAKPVVHSWYSRFCEDHPGLQKTFFKAVEKSRPPRSALLSAGTRIKPGSESAACLSGYSTSLRTRRKTRAQVIDPSNRETVTLIGTGSAAGEMTPPWVIFRTLPTLDYTYVDANPQMRFAKSETAFSNGEITVEWAQDFNRQPWAKSATVRHRGLRFEEWFGSDEFLRDPVRKSLPPKYKSRSYLPAQAADEAKKAVDSAFSSLLPSETRFQRASDTAKQVVEKYRDILSSPTRAGLCERIEKRYHEKKRGKRGKPVGDFAHNISLQELRDQQEEFLAESQEKEHRRQIRATRSILLLDIEKLKVEWRENKEVIINGATTKLQFKKWLKHTGKDKEFLLMDTQRSQMAQLLNEKTDGFIIDTQSPPEVSGSIRQAHYAPKPLNAVDWTALAGSDDTINFNSADRLVMKKKKEEERRRRRSF
ncbi:hypothetical protein BFJ63_vAg18523 [Fusarium oxysporum f. sp. narcissi]|uniref:HTH CENPB-type domain-containing protein n=1 Tax=Fusarium oxysporum f. sp. narcissi TaxID=451672 RepID=A0A4Q2UX14_FUSOX|nr:hypothetical protein BFJ63_vAg18523 [Fusarium oxysporum f. sp. narcissi]